jgi:hypothetical protein
LIVEATVVFGTVMEIGSCIVMISMLVRGYADVPPIPTLPAPAFDDVK